MKDNGAQLVLSIQNTLATNCPRTLVTISYLCHPFPLTRRLGAASGGSGASAGGAGETLALALALTPAAPAFGPAFALGKGMDLALDSMVMDSCTLSGCCVVKILRVYIGYMMYDLNPIQCSKISKNGLHFTQLYTFQKHETISKSTLFINDAYGKSNRSEPYQPLFPGNSFVEVL